jgi:hypothetical protein
MGQTDGLRSFGFLPALLSPSTGVGPDGNLGFFGSAKAHVGPIARSPTRHLQKEREIPTNIEAVPVVSASINGLSLISSGRMLYLKNAIIDHFSPSGLK